MADMRLSACLACCLLAASAGASADGLLLSLDEALRIPARDCPSPRGFDLTCTALDDAPIVCPVTDGNVGATVEIHASDRPSWRPGDRLHLRGTMTVSPEEHPFFAVTSVTVVGHVSLPPPREVSGTDIAGGSFNFQRVRVRGVVSTLFDDELDQRYVWMILNTQTSSVRVPIEKSVYPQEFLRTLIDAEIEVTGISLPTSGTRRRLGSQVNVRAREDLRVLKPRPADPFAAPPLANTLSPHRQRITGTVVAVGRDRFFLRTSTRRLVTVHPSDGQAKPEPGTTVTAVGFVEMDPFHARLYETLVRVDSTATQSDEKAVPVTLETLYDNFFKIERLNETDYHGQVLCLRGMVSAETDSIGGPATFLVTDGLRMVRVDLSATLEATARPAVGSQVEITGLCLADYTVTTPIRSFPRLRVYTLIPRTTGDIRVLSRPSWWTPVRLAALAGLLFAVLVGSGIWNLSLKRKSERRGRDLYQERIGHALAEQKVEERTRLAVELHDSVSQTLTGVSLQLDGGEIETAKAMLASCRGELRRCLWDLRCRTFEEKDMTEAVTRTITPHLNGCKATVRFNVPRERLSESLTHAILRIVRELVVNAIRHGAATHVKVAGEMHGNTVSFSVADDGTGFTPETAPGPEQGHFGLLGIRERIEDFDGNLKIASAPGRGAKFTVTLTAPDETNER